MSTTTPDDLHKRQMNINAHFAWALAMWASAEAAHNRKNYLLAAVGYYYSAFHAGFAVVNTNLAIPKEKLVQITHSALKAYLEPLLPPGGMWHYDLLQGIREGVNYLGADAPEGKLRIVRGNGFGFDLGESRFTFERGLEMAHKQSLSFLQICVAKLEAFCAENKMVGPKRGDSYWVNEYLDEDLLRGVIPREGDGIEIIKRAAALLQTDLNQKTPLELSNAHGSEPAA
ncbi:MAG TPA: hypothetical protein VGY56_07340 [Verrucomicrobiae bacterium]|nr:hypothetical protein [Verrucomicrobiae bacterium]